MSEPSCEFDPVDDLDNAFLERYRRGERPSLTEYTDRHPELADRIQALFPALVVLEVLGARDDEATSSLAGQAASGASMPKRPGLLWRKLVS
jgi:eukaryotic-like serine/threonine-protein kinase